jgi:hypothetical protein
MRLIDADRLTEEFLSWTMCDGASMYEIERTIDEQPTVDAEPVRHGRWEEHLEPIRWCEDDVDVFYKCSACQCTVHGESNYCPNCGAKMDEEVQ